VHTLDSIRSSPETLGFEEVKSAGFSAQAHQTSPAVRLAPVKPMPMCEDLERILAMVLPAAKPRVWCLTLSAVGTDHPANQPVHRQLSASIRSLIPTVARDFTSRRCQVVIWHFGLMAN